MRAFDAFVDDLSNWYIRRSRRRFWDGRRGRAARSGTALVQALRVIAPVMPFLAEHLWQTLVRGADGDPPESVLLAGWPEPGAADAGAARRGRSRCGRSSRSDIRPARRRS